jgi:hypothetical protein
MNKYTIKDYNEFVETFETYTELVDWLVKHGKEFFANEGSVWNNFEQEDETWRYKKSFS